MERGHLSWFTLQLEVKKWKCLQLKASQGRLLWHLQSGAYGCASWVWGCRVGLWGATLYPLWCPAGCPGLAARAEQPVWPRELSLLLCQHVWSWAGISIRSFAAIGQVTPSRSIICKTCIILSKCVVPQPLKWCIWVFEDGGSRSVQSVLNQSVFEPVLSKGLQYYVHMSRRMGLNFEHRYKHCV